MDATRPDPHALAERVAHIAAQLGIECALIGAAALAVHRYVRATKDVDLATYVDPYTKLRELDEALHAAGMETELRLPDEDDPLAGVLEVWTVVDSDDVPLDSVEVVNFRNPDRPRKTPARNAVARALPVPDTALRCVTLPDLIALKLYSGSRTDLVDIVELLVRNPDADLDEIRAIAGEFDATGVLETLIAEARAARA